MFTRQQVLRTFLIFTIYVALIDNVIISFGVDFHQYDDDTQFYITLNRSNIDAKHLNLFTNGS